VARQLRPGDSGARGISARHRSRNIGAPLEATGSLNWVSKDVTLRWKRDAITGTASYRDSSRGYRQSRQGMERRRGNGRVDGGGGRGKGKVKRSFEASWYSLSPYEGNQRRKYAAVRER
jgi:hypothetical protein